MQQELQVACTESLIDNFYTNKPENIIPLGVTKLTISDHYLIYGVRNFPVLKGATNIIEFCDFKNFNKEDFLEDVRSLDTLNLDSL